MNDENKLHRAFPMVAPDDDGSTFVQFGMTLRDYFAAKAMQAFLSRLPWETEYNDDDLSMAAYAIADAMLAERNK